MNRSLRTVLGAALYELPLSMWGLRPRWICRRPEKTWILVHNRGEQLIDAPGNMGVRCGWQWTSALHVARVFPGIGLRLMRRALDDWPIRLDRGAPARTERPVVSFIIGHRGEARAPSLETTLESLAAQDGVSCECIVVEQSHQHLLQQERMPWVRLIHTPSPQGMPYNRAWAFNVGATHARGHLLVFHDNDMLVPTRYAAELWRHFQTGYEVLNLKRFIFYLDQQSSSHLCASGRPQFALPPIEVVQNLEAGGSLAVSARVLEDLGGFDESFVGWGGEDNEFWERAQTRKVYPWGYLPILHLWHPAQPEKADARARSGTERYKRLSARPVAERIAALTKCPRGRMEGPVSESGLNPVRGLPAERA